MPCPYFTVCPGFTVNLKSAGASNSNTTVEPKLKSPIWSPFANEMHPWHPWDWKVASKWFLSPRWYAPLTFVFSFWKRLKSKIPFNNVQIIRWFVWDLSNTEIGISLLRIWFAAWSCAMYTFTRFVGILYVAPPCLPDQNERWWIPHWWHPLLSGRRTHGTICRSTLPSHWSWRDPAANEQCLGSHWITPLKR